MLAGFECFSLLPPSPGGLGLAVPWPLWGRGVSCPGQGVYVRQGLTRGCRLLTVSSCQTTGLFQVSDSAPSLCFLGGYQALAQ